MDGHLAELIWGKNTTQSILCAYNISDGSYNYISAQCVTWLTDLWLASGNRRGSIPHNSRQSYAELQGTLQLLQSQTQVQSTTPVTSDDTSSPKCHTTHHTTSTSPSSQCTCYWHLLDSVTDEPLLPGAVRRCWQLAQSYHCHVMSQWSCTASAIAARAPRAISTTSHNKIHCASQPTNLVSINQSKLPVFSLVFYLNDWQHTKCFSNVPELTLLW